MKEAVLVNVVQRLRHLVGDVFDLDLLQGLTFFLPLLDYPIEIFFYVLEDKVGLVFYPHHLFEFDDVRVL